MELSAFWSGLLLSVPMGPLSFTFTFGVTPLSPVPELEWPSVSLRVSLSI